MWDFEVAGSEAEAEGEDTRSAEREEKRCP